VARGTEPRSAVCHAGTIGEEESLKRPASALCGEAVWATDVFDGEVWVLLPPSSVAAGLQWSGVDACNGVPEHGRHAGTDGCAERAHPRVGCCCVGNGWEFSRWGLLHAPCLPLGLRPATRPRHPTPGPRCYIRVIPAVPRTTGGSSGWRPRVLRRVPLLALLLHARPPFSLELCAAS
jgi:hypothetical protein